MKNVLDWVRVINYENQSNCMEDFLITTMKLRDYEHCQKYSNKHLCLMRFWKQIQFYRNHMQNKQKQIKASHLKERYHMPLPSPSLPSMCCCMQLWSASSPSPSSLFPICFPFDPIATGLPCIFLFGSTSCTCP